MVQWLGLHASNAGGLGSISGQGTRSRMLQLRPRVPVCHSYGPDQPHKSYLKANRLTNQIKLESRGPQSKATSQSEGRLFVSDSLQPHGLYSPSNSPGQNTGVGSLSLLQIFSTQGSNPGLPHCKRILYQLSHKGNPLCIQRLTNSLYK